MDEFIDGYVLRSLKSGAIKQAIKTEDGFRTGSYVYKAVPCNCGDKDCEGWQMTGERMTSEMPDEIWVRPTSLDTRGLLNSFGDWIGGNEASDDFKIKYVRADRAPAADAELLEVLHKIRAVTLRRDTMLFSPHMCEQRFVVDAQEIMDICDEAITRAEAGRGNDDRK